MQSRTRIHQAIGMIAVFCLIFQLIFQLECMNLLSRIAIFMVSTEVISELYLSFLSSSCPSSKCCFSPVFFFICCNPLFAFSIQPFCYYFLWFTSLLHFITFWRIALGLKILYCKSYIIWCCWQLIPKLLQCLTLDTFQLDIYLIHFYCF